MSNNVKTFKLISGEEVIARVVEETETTIVVEKPRVLTLASTGHNGQVGIQMYPWIVSAVDGGAVTMHKTAISASTTPNKELETGYLSNTTGLQLVTG